MPDIFTREVARQRALDRRMQAAQHEGGTLAHDTLTALQNGTIPRASFAEGFDISEHINLIREGAHTVVEFNGQTLPAMWTKRQRYEVEAGRDQEPLLYPAIYSITEDPTLPERFDINALGPAGVVFEEVHEGGTVRFASLQEGEKSVRLRQYASGIEYNERIFRFNQLFRLPVLERQFGIAANALLNHIHFAPILNHSYVSEQQTAASSNGTTLLEKYHNTLDEAIANSRADSTWPRRGPYALLVSGANLSMVRRALMETPQEGLSVQSPEVLGSLQSVIAYDGWTGSRGKSTTTYPGVTSGKAYLINLAHRDEDFQSYVQQPLRQQRRDGDLNRFIVEEVVYDMWFGLYAAPRAAVEEITWPTS